MSKVRAFTGKNNKLNPPRLGPRGRSYVRSRAAEVAVQLKLECYTMTRMLRDVIVDI